jgi:hypothetical protein
VTVQALSFGFLGVSQVVRLFGAETTAGRLVLAGLLVVFGLAAALNGTMWWRQRVLRHASPPA